MVPRTSYRGMSNEPLPPAVKSINPDIGRGEFFVAVTLSSGMALPSKANEYVPFHYTTARPVPRPVPLTISIGSSVTPLPSRRTAAVADSKSSP